MSYPALFDRAYGLCVKCNSHAIAHDLHLMTEIELMGVISFLLQLQAN
jgi:hypothetical protein